ncbi:MAG: hypothetical protein HQL46_12340, partial [Gammaproteobacteria bacterium]|nr:hypothetical protein [Gammaproteobacteria bacterium]
INDREELDPLLKDRVSRIFAKNHNFGGIHVFTSSIDIPDDYAKGPRLVVLPTHAAYSRGDAHLAYEEAEKILRNRGEQPRQKQNRLIFFAADYDVVSRLKDVARTFIAWRSIVNDVSEGKLDLTISLSKQAKHNADSAEQSLHQIVRETYKWLICPVEDFIRGKPELTWETVSVSPSAQNLVSEIENTLREEEWLISEWSPIHLRNMLQQWYLKDGATEISALRVWQDSCHYLYLPRLVNDQVFKNAINQGLSSKDYFGYASGKDGDRYLGFNFGHGSISFLDDSSLLIEREAAAEYREATKPVPPTTPGTPPEGQGVGSTDTSSTGSTIQPPPSPESTPDTPPIQTAVKKQFYGTIELDPVKAKMDFATIVDEVVQQFTAKLGVDVSISVEIQANSKDGFDEALQRTIKENCNVLKFSSSEFEED